MNRKFISKSNFVLRKVLNSDIGLDILKDIIESILDIKIEKIKLNPYLYKRERYLPKEENFGIADVRILAENNEEINIGIQFVDGKYIPTKILMYYEQIHLNQLEYEDERKFAKTITINIIDFIYFKFEEILKKIKIECNENFVKNEELELYIIQLAKFKPEECVEFNRKEQWITYFKGDNKELIEKAKDENEYIKKFDDLLENYWNNEKME